MLISSSRLNANESYTEVYASTLLELEKAHKVEMRCWRQFKLLLWKNYLLQKRAVLITSLQLILPAIFAAVLIYVRHRVEPRTSPKPTEWDPFSFERLQPAFCPTYGACLLDNWSVYYAPDNSLTKRVMERARRSMGFVIFSHIKEVIGFPTEDSLVQEFMMKMNNASTGILTSKCDILGGVVFTNLADGSDHFPPEIEYKIRLPYTPRTSNFDFHVDPLKLESNWRTDTMFPQYEKTGPRNKDIQYGNDPGYLQEGFLTLQKHVDQSIIEEINPSTNTSLIKLELSRMPYPPYRDDPFILVIQDQFPFVIMLSFIFTALHIIKSVVHEKERRLKESMKMMGLNNWLHWAAWFTKYFLFLSISIAIITVLFSVSTGHNGGVLGFTHWSVLLVFLMLYAVALISCSFAISVFFSKANTGTAVGGLLFFVSYIPYVFLQQRYSSLSLATKLSASLLPNVAMAFGCQVIGMFEGTGAGVQWATIERGISVDDNFSMFWVYVMLIADAVIYGLVAWYVEAVWPGEHGVPKPWYFPLMSSYWCGSNLADYDVERRRYASADCIEAVNGEFNYGIRMIGLRKVFGSGSSKRIAVDCLDLDIYEGQITVLLGHNGAGKTTTMSMLTGFFPPSSGTALLNGHDIVRDTTGARESLGLCPQHNVLFDTLTVNEHLEFFAKLKGCGADLAREERRVMLETLKFEDKAHCQTYSLSGGMKRKLSVGIALIGGSKILILDEPTSGMDPDARRHTWDILQSHRSGRTILLTTHVMNEADVLGDRIAIMADGAIQCCGSPLFLKHKYGAGYHLAMVEEPGCDVSAVTSLVKKYVPEASLETDVCLKLSYVLPQDSKSNFVSLFEAIDSAKHQLKISSYGASVTTMEEVFLRVGKNNVDSNCDADSGLVENVSSSSSSSDNSEPISDEIKLLPAEYVTGVRLWARQFNALLTKRVLHSIRNLRLSIVQILMPVLFTVITLTVIKTQPKPHDSVPLTLNLKKFGANKVVYSEPVKPDVQIHELGLRFSGLLGDGTETEQIHNQTITEFMLNLAENDIVDFNRKYMIAAQFLPSKIIGYFNAQAYHTAAISLNTLSNTLLKYATDSNVSISAINHPMPRTQANKLNEMVTKGYDGYTIALNVIFGMSFLTSSFLLFIIRERNNKAKKCQIMSGVSHGMYWLASFFWDYINFVIPSLLIIIAFIAFDIEAYAEHRRYLDILALFLLYGWAVLPAMYLLSFLFTVPSSGFIWISILNIVTGLVTVLAVNILTLPGLGTANIAKVLEWIFLPVLPHYCLGQALSDFFFNHKFIGICTDTIVRTGCAFGVQNPCCKGNCGDQCVDYSFNYLSWSSGGIGRHMIFLACQGVVYFTILLVIESKILIRVRICSGFGRTETNYDPLLQDEDGDVASERQRISETSNDVLLKENPLVLNGLTKYYGEQMALDGITLAVRRGECFGLLGVNGAGKTTIFKLLVGEVYATEGEAYVNSRNIKTLNQAHQKVGYCPQFDALINEMTGRETLILYAKLRGVPAAKTASTVNKLLNDLQLAQYADRLVVTYSGGNKRKLSTAVALVGDPTLVFLDEPTTGMDPGTRRSLWRVLAALTRKGTTLVLTSHCIEECEALCTRVAIMGYGQMRCLGSPQHLKNKFGEGYTIITEVKPPDTETPGEYTKSVAEHIISQFPNSTVKDSHRGMINIHVGNTGVGLSQIFSIMESAKNIFHIEDYSVSQTTLEQVFVNLAQEHQSPTGNMRPRRCNCCGIFC